MGDVNVGLRQALEECNSAINKMRMAVYEDIGLMVVDMNTTLCQMFGLSEDCEDYPIEDPRVGYYPTEDPRLKG